MKIFLTLGALSIALILSGCDTATVRPYSPSTDNVVKMRSALAESNIRLNQFNQDSEIGQLNCRLLGPINIGATESKAKYIHDAFKGELLIAGVYDDDSDIVISGRLDSVDFSSLSPASWELVFTISSNKSDGYTVSTKHPFKTSYSAISACRNVSDAWGPAVQQLIREIMEHPEFLALF